MKCELRFKTTTTKKETPFGHADNLADYLDNLCESVKIKHLVCVDTDENIYIVNTVTDELIDVEGFGDWFDIANEIDAILDVEELYPSDVEVIKVESFKIRLV